MSASGMRNAFLGQGFDGQSSKGDQLGDRLSRNRSQCTIGCLIQCDRTITGDLHSLKKIDVDTQNNFLKMVLYKHENQMRKEKSMQYLKKVTKIIPRIILSDILQLLDTVGIDTSKFHRSENDNVPGNEVKIQLSKRLLMESKTTLKAISLSSNTALHIIDSLQYGTFVTFNVFALSCICRIRVLLKRLCVSLLRVCAVTLKLLPDSGMDEILQDLTSQLNSLKSDFMDFEPSTSPSVDIRFNLKEEPENGSPLDADQDVTVDIGEIVVNHSAEKVNKDLCEDLEYLTFNPNIDIETRKVIPAPNFPIRAKEKFARNLRRCRKKHTLSCVCWICLHERVHFKQLRATATLLSWSEITSGKKRTFYVAQQSRRKLILRKRAARKNIVQETKKSADNTLDT